MAKRIAKFEKVSFEQFKGGYTDAIGEASDEQIREVYDSLKLPKRAAITLKPGETAKIPTGIRAKMEDNWVLQCYPRSGLGFKFRLQLNNTVGIIDSDYYYSDNEGHIFAKITNDTNEGKTVEIPAGTGFMQGIFMEYGITVDDEVHDKIAGNDGFCMKY